VCSFVQLSHNLERIATERGFHIHGDDAQLAAYEYKSGVVTAPRPVHRDSALRKGPGPCTT